jgi:adenylosuccinate lyase
MQRGSSTMMHKLAKLSKNPKNPKNLVTLAQVFPQKLFVTCCTRLLF